MLSELTKKHISDFMLGNTDTEPIIYDEIRQEALEYADFICKREKLKLLSKLCNTTERK